VFELDHRGQIGGEKIGTQPTDLARTGFDPGHAFAALQDIHQ